MNEPYGTATDETPLTWDIEMPVGATCVPWIFTIESAHWVIDRGVLPDVTQSILNKGWAPVHPWHRLAPPGLITGQVGDGRFPQQTDDLEMAVAAALLDPRCDGRVGVVGGSGGANEAAFLQAKGLVFAAVLFSPATYLPDLEGTGPAWGKAVNYAATAEDREAASPLIYLDVAISKPVMLVAYDADQMPANQYTGYDNKLIELGIEHESHLLVGAKHSWPARKKVDWVGYLSNHLP